MFKICKRFGSHKSNIACDPLTVIFTEVKESKYEKKKKKSAKWEIK